MLETITIITLTLLLMSILRPGKTPPLENPLTINRVGQFHAVLAPKINLAQPLLEAVSRNFPEQMRQGDTLPLYFKVQDKEVQAHGRDFYLLAATLRDGMLYFQATSPNEGSSHFETIRAFSEAELSKHPATKPQSENASQALVEAIQAAATQRGATAVQLGAAG